MTHSGTHARVRMPRPVALLAALVATLLLAVAGTLSVPSPAQAHDSLISTVPAPDDELAEPPASLTLTFSAGVLSLGDAAVVIVTAPDGTAISDGSPVIDGETVVQAVDATVDAGTYLVQWRVVSSDGHPISGEFSYTTSTSAAAAPTATPSPSASTTPEPVPQTSTSTAPASAAHETPEELTSFIVIAVLIFAGLVLVTVLLVIRRARQRTRARDEPESQQ